jgi:glycine cleavage system H protein
MNKSNTPNDLKYAKTHEWVRVEEDGTVTVGITDHAQELLGDLVFVELPDKGQEVEAEEQCAVVESVKAASDIYSPVAGEVIAINTSLNDSPQLVNSGPYDEGWLFKLKPTNLKMDLAQLLTAAQYEEQIQSE